MKEPYLPHPNLSPEINANIAESALQGGVWVRQPFGELVKGEPFLPVGHGLTITTQNTTYTVDKTGADEFLISGHQKYCPAPTKCSIHGSTWGGVDADGRVDRARDALGVLNRRENCNNDYRSRGRRKEDAMTEPRHRRSVKGLLDSLTTVANKCEKERVDSSANVDHLRARVAILIDLLRETQSKHDSAQSELRRVMELYDCRVYRVELMRELIELFNVEEPKGE